jgi:hypothetical protein
MDGERGNAENGPIDVEELVGQQAATSTAAPTLYHTLTLSLLPDDDSAGHLEVAVEPGVPKAAAIDLDGHLGVALALNVDRERLDLEGGGVGVGGNDAAGATGLVLLPDGEGDDGGGVSGEEVLAAPADVAAPHTALM